VINNIGGLGSALMRSGWLNGLIRLLYRTALARSKVVFFQNEDDMAFFIESRLARREQARRLPGSGIDTAYFTPRYSARHSNGSFGFLFVGRLLWDKGLGEFVEAIRQLRAMGLHAEGRVLGFLDVQNPSAVSREQLLAWVHEGIIQYLGESDDVRPYVAAADCVVLPSYREGIPRSLLEAGSMAKPMITTDAPGCREVVEHGLSGYSVPVKNASALCAAMKRMLQLPDIELAKMGSRGRAIMVERYDETIVIAAYRAAIAGIEND
jgi:glycosyltransferase involved in cell wall biosynthesis